MRSLGHVIYSRDTNMLQVLKTAENVASSKATVLIQGESGTGKELLARYIHSKSHRCSKRMVAINCAAMPEGLLESELFGFEKGAFTGADQRKMGKFEVAERSSFLLDEVSELPLLLQAKLLRVLQESEVERLGAREPTKIDVRLIATSNRSLKQMVEEKSFREDLYYRLNVIPLVIPPLRERRGDIALLARLFLEVSCAENQLEPKELSPEAGRILLQHTWPGNVRELQNVIERAALLANEKTIRVAHLEGILLGESLSAKAEAHIMPGVTVAEVEKQLIIKTLQHTHNNRTQAAHLLGISIRTLRNKLNAYKLGVQL